MYHLLVKIEINHYTLYLAKYMGICGEIYVYIFHKYKVKMNNFSANTLKINTFFYVTLGYVLLLQKYILLFVVYTCIIESIDDPQSSIHNFSITYVYKIWI